MSTTTGTATAPTSTDTGLDHPHVHDVNDPGHDHRDRARLRRPDLDRDDAGLERADEHLGGDDRRPTTVIRAARRSSRCGRPAPAAARCAAGTAPASAAAPPPAAERPAQGAWNRPAEVGALHAGREPSLASELVEMRREGDGGDRPQPRVDLAPRRIEQLIDRAAPPSSAAISRRSRSRRWARYSSIFARGSSITGPCPGHSNSGSRSRSRAAPSGSRRARRGRRPTNTLPCPSTASPLKPTPPERGRRGDRRVAGERERLERPESRSVVAAARRHRPAGSRHRRVREALAQWRDRLAVIGVVMGERDPAETAAALAARRSSASRCAGSAGPGSISHAGVRPDDP